MNIGVLTKRGSKNYGACMGCTACMNICPCRAISMERNQEGFFEAHVDEKMCSECGECIEICQALQKNTLFHSKKPLYYAAFSRDMDNVQNSSSGGVFFELSKSILEMSGVIYGAVQKSVFEVEHRRGETLEEAELFRRSKYLESALGSCYRDVKEDLENGKQVLFSGVGCQIAGLYCFLKKDYQSLYTCEVVCHGIPSYLAYEKYIYEKGRQIGAQVSGINFRDKRFGWKDNAICEYFENGEEDVSYSSIHRLHSLYLKGINMRSNCGSCKYAKVPRIADVTLADFWQYQGGLAELNANRGISLIAVNNERGQQLIDGISNKLYFEKVDEAMALKSCRHMNNSPLLNESQKVFMKLLQYTSFSFASAICSEFGPIVEEKELHKVIGISEKYIWDVFWKDEREIVYVLDESKKVRGIVTYGSFIRNYEKKEQWVNDNFRKVTISETCIVEIKSIFDSDFKINRIPVVDKEGFLIFEVRRDGGKTIPYQMDETFLKTGQKYEDIFNKKHIEVISEREQWKEKDISSDVFLVDTVYKKNILKLKYNIDSVYGEDYAKEMRLMEPFLRLYFQEIEVYYIKRPGLLSDYDYTQEEQERIKGEKSFPKLSEDIEANEGFFRKIFQGKFSYAYIEGLRKIPQIVEKNGRYQHIDQVSEYVNVFGGCRKTMYQPKKYQSTIHIYGRCGAFGYAVDDSDTMPSMLQKRLMESGREIRVVNHGLWGADNEKILHNLSMDVMEGVIKRNDKVVLYMDYLPYMKRLQSLNLNIQDTTVPFHEFKKNKEIFYDKPGHMTAKGYEYISELLDQMLSCPFVTKPDEEEKKNIQEFFFCFQNKKNRLNEYGLEKYLQEIERQISDKIDLAKKTGAIVMNCNPFTIGHRYLIEIAAREVDNLLIFVLEEDRSFFSFKDRLQMVRNGTEDLENVYVFPSGKFMISALTFPEYFIKEQEKNIKINPIEDVQIFAGDIAPRFHITVRFAGTEPKDNVTKQYNDVLREQLPIYGINFIEINRLEKKGEVVTATEVRRRFISGDFENLKEMVPITTYDYMRDLKRKGEE